MSEEENKAIEDLKRLRKGIEILNQVAPEKDDTDIKAIDIILHLIEKQQKLINQLLEDMKERANNFSYESEIMWRKIEKAEKLLGEN